ncbi:hypothetical protein SESBI_20928 [Sesbania bispinosa]|nr:hypothetical protein SESBI_20928 [Sesbania bispinosa]
MSQEVTYRPQCGAADGIPKDSNMVAIVTIGFVKDAVHHIDVSGFNVYHKNRLIKINNSFELLGSVYCWGISAEAVWTPPYLPFWRIWNPAGSGGRGVIGVLEANFVEPAHDKQGFERTLVLSRLESRLIQMQKNYWGSNCHKIGYASNRTKKQINDSADKAERNGGRVMKKIKEKDDNDGEQPLSDSDLPTSEQLKKENRELKERLERKEEEVEEVLQALQYEKDRCKSLETQLHAAEQKIEDLNKEQETIIDVFSEERDRRDAEEKNLRKKLQDASNTIQELLDKVRLLERKSSSGK